MAAEVCTTGDRTSKPASKVGNPILVSWPQSGSRGASCFKSAGLHALALLIFPTDKNKPLQSNFELN